MAGVGVELGGEMGWILEQEATFDRVLLSRTWVLCKFVNFKFIGTTKKSMHM